MVQGLTSDALEAQDAPPFHPGGQAAMSKKQDFIQDQQNRDAHPDSTMKGSAASVAAEAARKSPPLADDPDRKAGHQGKVANDRNKMGEQAPTQKNEGRRSPESRHDREGHLGSHNQAQARQDPSHGGEGRGTSTGGRNR
jgi:hypothetical protein